MDQPPTIAGDYRRALSRGWRYTTMSSSREDKATVQETLDDTYNSLLRSIMHAYWSFNTVLFEMSQLLNTELDRDQLAL